MNRIRIIYCLALFIVFLVGFVRPVTGQSEGSVERGQICMEDTVRRQFDFWVGEWDVYVNDEKVAESIIERTLGGCMIMENYTNLKSGYAGKSMNFYDVDQEKWIQIWTDVAGNVARYTGELRDNKMYFYGKNINRNTEESQVRMEFTPNTDGSVRQIYEQSTDGDETWDTLFDGLYRAKAKTMDGRETMESFCI